MKKEEFEKDFPVAAKVLKKYKEVFPSYNIYSLYKMLSELSLEYEIQLRGESSVKIKELKERVEFLADLNVTLSNANNGLSDRVRKLENTNQTLMFDIEDLSSRIDELEELPSVYENLEKESLTKETKKLYDEIERLNNLNISIGQENEKLIEENKILEEEVKELENLNNSYQKCEREYTATELAAKLQALGYFGSLEKRGDIWNDSIIVGKETHRIEI